MASTPHIDNDLIEQYVLGQLDAALSRQVEAAADGDPAVRRTIDELRAGLEHYVRSLEVHPPGGVKERILAKLTAADVEPAAPPVIHEMSTIADYARWLNAPDMVRPANAEDVFFIPFAQNAQGLSAVVWLVHGSPEETHTDLIEKFLVVEGSCEIHMRGRVFPLAVGDVLSIPLHTPHTVRVTSTVPCKVVLQRIAA